jgi:Eukaryotic aspartyl protease
MALSTKSLPQTSRTTPFSLFQSKLALQLRLWNWYIASPCSLLLTNPSQDFDSGSADTWVWSTKLPQNVISQGKKNGNEVFDPTKSSTFKNMPGSTWKIQYGDQSTASGTVGTDVLKVGDITIKSQAIELADQLSDQFQTSVGR